MKFMFRLCRLSRKRHGVSRVTWLFFPFDKYCASISMFIPCDLLVTSINLASTYIYLYLYFLLKTYIYLYLSFLLKTCRNFYSVSDERVSSDSNANCTWQAPVVPKSEHIFIKIKGPFILSASGI